MGRSAEWMDKAMSGITLETAQSILDALLEQRAAGVSHFGSVTIGGRTVTYRTSQDLAAEINYWARVVAGLQRQAGGESRHGFSVANFRSRQ